MIGIGQDSGCDENGKSGSRVEGLHFTGFKIRGWNNFGFESHMLWDCEVGPIAPGQPETNRLGIASRNFRNFYIGRCLVHGVIGDDVFLQDCDGGVVIDEYNTFLPADGGAADSFQISQGGLHIGEGHGCTVYHRGGIYDQRGGNGGKGNLVDSQCGTVIVEDFRAYGLNFSMSPDSDNVIIRRGHISDARLNTYSWGVGIGGTRPIRDILFEDLLIENCNRGVAISATGGGANTGPTRIDIVARRVTVRNCSTGLFIDRPCSGDFTGITYENCGINKDVRTTTVPPGGTYTTLTY